MEKFKVSFEANNQQLKSLGTKHASDTYADIEATFVLGEKWTDMDSVSAVWWNDFTRIATVLDSQGKCVVPHEVLTRKGCVRVNLVGSIVEGDELITRLTSYSAEAVQVNEKIKLTGNEPQSITPSQYEQFVQNVKADADRAEAGATASANSADEAEASAQNASESASASAVSASDSARSATASAESAQDASEIAVEVEVMKNEVELAKDMVLGMRATAETLEAGSDATASYSDGLLTLGIPRGDQGEQGIQGETGATPNLTIGTVETLAPTEDATATITGTAENPVLNLGLPKGDTGEVSYEELSSLLPRDTASGDIVSIPDGQSVIPAESLKVELEPIQSGSGTPSPDNVRPISGHTEVVTYDDPKYGGTIEWNQLVQNGDFADTSVWQTLGVSVSVADNAMKITRNNNGITTIYQAVNAPANHKYLWTSEVKGDAEYTNWVFSFGSAELYVIPITTAWVKQTKIIAKTSDSVNFNAIRKNGGASGDVVYIRNAMLIDLTQMFGSTKADEIYAMEQAQTGSGIAYFKSLFPHDYYEYNEGEETCVSAVNGDEYHQYTTTLGRTVYGGEVEVVEGELTDKMGIVDLGTLTWQKYGTYSDMDRYVSASIDSTAKDGETNAICSIYPLKWGANGFVIGGGSAKLSVLTELGQYSSVADFKTAMSGVQLCYELATPQTYQLTPQEIKLLLGTNNVWSDGNVTLVYSADIQRWVEKKLNGNSTTSMLSMSRPMVQTETTEAEETETETAETE